MAAPAHTARSTPTGRYIPDGFVSKIAFAVKPAFGIWEKAVKPGGREIGSIDTSTMHNVSRRTKRAKKLATEKDRTIQAAYDPDIETSGGDLDSLLGVEGSISQYWPDGSYTDFFGFLDDAEYGDHKEGEFPEVTLKITVTNWDPVNNVEVAPVFHPAAGT